MNNDENPSGIYEQALQPGPPGIPVREFPGIPGNPPSQEFPREFPGITEFSAGICGNFKNLQI